MSRDLLADEAPARAASPAGEALEAELEHMLIASRRQRAAIADLLAVVLDRLAAARGETHRG